MTIFIFTLWRYQRSLIESGPKVKPEWAISISMTFSKNIMQKLSQIKWFLVVVWCWRFNIVVEEEKNRRKNSSVASFFLFSQPSVFPLLPPAVATHFFFNLSPAAPISCHHFFFFFPYRCWRKQTEIKKNVELCWYFLSLL